MINLPDWVKEVKPILNYPPCYKTDILQNCFECDRHLKDTCKSLKRLCIISYSSHRKGCPNYNKKKGCPPNVRMFDYYFDMTKPIYAIYNAFDIKSHMAKMKEKHPHWTDRQCRNPLYWQKGARKKLKEHIAQFHSLFSDENFAVTTVPEAMGVNVSETMKNIGIILTWPPEKFAYQIALAGKLKCSKEEFDKDCL